MPITLTEVVVSSVINTVSDKFRHRSTWLQNNMQRAAISHKKMIAVKT
ncbi:hypothetical protein [Chitinophaga terrae (ex Kim and Jung 2007)]|nr:hypothetical protein [Chitinophaga terrae (ex Kim and Jung 2007)]MDQ0108208.1 hypothetical protein [Chitinophaga terrae (ex Kim and Jung 2007)]